MANYDDMRKLMEQLLPRFYPDLFSNPDIDSAPESFAPISHISRKLFTILCDVFTVKQLMIVRRWKNFCSSNFINTLSSHEMYVRYIMFACNIEMRLSENVFDKILNVWALVINYIVLTLKHTGVNYCELCIDVFMVFYKRALKKSFFRQGGFKRLAEYIQEEYHSIASQFGKDSNHSNTLAENKKLFLTNAVVKFCENTPFEFGTKVHDDIMKNVESQKLANDVLSIKKIKLPFLPSSNELKARLRGHEQQKAVGTDKTETIPTISSKLEAPVDEYKCEMYPNDSLYETSTDSSKRETLTDDYKLKTSVDDSILMTSTKRKMPITSLNLETLVDENKFETHVDDNKCETHVDDYRCETHVNDSIYTTPVSNSKRVTPTYALRHKTSTVGLNSEIQTGDHKADFSAIDLICKTPADITVYETPADITVYETPADKTVYETPADKTVYKTPAGDSGYKTRAGDSGYKTLTKHSNYKPPAEESVTPLGVLKFQMTELNHRSLNYQAIDLVADKVNIEWYGNIVRMITKYNTNKLSNCDNLNKKILEKTRNILENLKARIKNLIEVLAEFDEERNF